MFSKTWSFGSFFAKLSAAVEHDVEAMIADFTSTATKLETAAEAKAKEAYAHYGLSRKYEQLSDEAEAAAQKARNVAAKIKELVS